MGEGPRRSEQQRDNDEGTEPREGMGAAALLPTLGDSAAVDAVARVAAALAFAAAASGVPADLIQ